LVVCEVQSVEVVHAARRAGLLTGRGGRTLLGALAGNCGGSDEGEGLAAGRADKTAIRTAGGEDSASASLGGDGGRGPRTDGGRVARRDSEGCHDDWVFLNKVLSKQVPSWGGV
jgi:hypothetical protein